MDWTSNIKKKKLGTTSHDSKLSGPLMNGVDIGISFKKKNSLFYLDSNRLTGT